MKPSPKFICLALLFALPGCTRFGGEGGSSYNLNGCKGNLKNLSTALEMYATDNSGQYPSSLSRLTVGDAHSVYLRAVPHCNSTDEDTYSASYKMSAAKRDAKGKIVSGTDAYTVCCQGEHHKDAGLPPDHPLYSSAAGLIER
jgi:hypothetical protein